MIVTYLTMVAILFFKMRAKLFICKTYAGLDFPWVVFLHSETVGPIIMEKKRRFSMMTPFNLEAGVIGQVQHLEKIPRI